MSEVKAPLLSAYAQFESDKDKEAQGSWVQIGTMKFKIARAGGANEAFLKEVARRFKPLQAAINNDQLPAAMAQKIVVEVFADTIVLDWQDVAGRDGQELPYSKENCVVLLTDLPNLFAELQRESQNASNFSREQLEAAAGN